MWTGSSEVLLKRMLIPLVCEELSRYQDFTLATQAWPPQSKNYAAIIFWVLMEAEEYSHNQQ